MFLNNASSMTITYWTYITKGRDYFLVPFEERKEVSSGEQICRHISVEVSSSHWVAFYGWSRLVVAECRLQGQLVIWVLVRWKEELGTGKALDRQAPVWGTNWVLLWYPVSPHVSVFVWKRRYFPLVWPTVHTYPVKTITENASFQKRSPERKFLKTLASCLHVDRRKRRFSNSMISYIVYY